MLSLLRKKLQSCVTNNVFLHKQLKSQQEIKKSNLKPLPEPGTEPGTSRSPRGYVTSAQPSQLRVQV